jgi:hypothetical protein
MFLKETPLILLEPMLKGIDVAALDKMVTAFLL